MYNIFLSIPRIIICEEAREDKKLSTITITFQIRKFPYTKKMAPIQTFF